MIKLRPDTWVPKYEQIKNIIRNEISKGKYAAGSRIPSENKLPKLFNVGKNTVLKAVGDLVNDGILYREQGRGTFVANLHSPRSDSRNIGLYLMSQQRDMTDAEKLTFFTPNYPIRVKLS
ncbi:GntR family transcriptional regulator [bacterium]|nr:GntR family transcriptional regulator [bacterium]